MTTLIQSYEPEIPPPQPETNAESAYYECAPQQFLNGGMLICKVPWTDEMYFVTVQIKDRIDTFLVPKAGMPEFMDKVIGRVS